MSDENVPLCLGSPLTAQRGCPQALRRNCVSNLWATAWLGSEACVLVFVGR